MELVLDPAALVGVIGMTALFGWALGRTQTGRDAARSPIGNHVTSPAIAGPPAPLAASPIRRPDAPGQGLAGARGDRTDGRIAAPSACQQRALEERRAIFDDPIALADLHEEVCSIREDERIFESGLEDTGLMVMLARGEGSGCRYIGRIGQPTCPGPINGTCHDGGTCSAPRCNARPCILPDPARERTLAGH